MKKEKLQINNQAKCIASLKKIYWFNYDLYNKYCFIFVLIVLEKASFWFILKYNNNNNNNNNKLLFN